VLVGEPESGLIPRQDKEAGPKGAAMKKPLLVGAVLLIWAAFPLVLLLTNWRSGDDPPGVTAALDKLNRPGGDRRAALMELREAFKRSRKPDEHFAAAAAFTQLLTDPELRRDAADSLDLFQELQLFMGKAWRDSSTARLRQDPVTSTALDAGRSSDDGWVRAAVCTFLSLPPENLCVLVREAAPSNPPPFYERPSVSPSDKEAEVSQKLNRYLTERLEGAGYRVTTREEDADIVFEHTGHRFDLNNEQRLPECHLFAWDPRRHRLLDAHVETTIDFKNQGGAPGWFDKDERGVYAKSYSILPVPAGRPGVSVVTTAGFTGLNLVFRSVTGTAKCDIVRYPAEGRARVRVKSDQTLIGHYDLGGGEAYEYRLRVDVYDTATPSNCLYTKELEGADPSTRPLVSGTVRTGFDVLADKFLAERVADELGVAINRAVAARGN
jgi:hypothetical protein